MVQRGDVEQLGELVQHRSASARTPDSGVEAQVRDVAGNYSVNYATVSFVDGLVTLRSRR